MELLSVGIAKSIWLFDINELNPAGKMIFPDALKWLAEKYSFQEFPKSITDFSDDKGARGYVFKSGEFQAGGENVLVNFAIYNDGVVADTWSSTEKGDLFIEEIMRSAANRYGLPLLIDSIQKRLYVSELNVRMKSPFDKLHPGLDEFNRTLDRLFARHKLPPFETTGIIFASDNSDASYKPPGFLIERKTSVPFKSNRFWSKSPFTTADHLNALEEFEKLLAK
jgi:hypothetical protein